ncbi:MAG: methyltransferase domain-containing protein [Chloroflexota bacterium]
MSEQNERLAASLWEIYRRAERPFPWHNGGNLPWDDPDFSERMLREHLNENHGAASRITVERLRQIEWLWEKLGLAAGQRFFDVTCGPGLYAVELAQRGVRVQGIDFAPAAIAYARELAAAAGVTEHCTFVQQDIHQMTVEPEQFDAAMLIYGQLGVMRREEAQVVLNKICAGLRPGGRVCLELLDPSKVDKKNSNWWYTDRKRLWGDAPFLHLGERFWDEAAQMSLERFYVVHLETGKLDVVELCDQIYAPEEIVSMLQTAGFSRITTHPGWDGLEFYDADEWIAYVAQKPF